MPDFVVKSDQDVKPEDFGPGAPATDPPQSGWLSPDQSAASVEVWKEMFSAIFELADWPSPTWRRIARLALRFRQFRAAVKLELSAEDRRKSRHIEGLQSDLYGRPIKVTPKL